MPMYSRRSSKIEKQASSKLVGYLLPSEFRCNIQLDMVQQIRRPGRPDELRRESNVKSI